MGGDILVRGSVGLARRLQVPDFVVAATVVGFGTSLPELVVSIRAATSGYPNLILGNVVGSNTANVLLVGGASALIFPILPEVGPVRRNVVIMVLAIIGFAILAGLNGLGHFGGVALLLAFFAIMAATARSTLQARRKVDPSMPLDWVLGMPSRPVTIAVCILFGILTLPLGADLLVDSAVEIAQRFYVSETVIGLTVLAIGTSLPELTTAVLAALERRSDVAIGAIIGSNTFNVLAIMGAAAALSAEPIPVSSRFLAFDMPVMMISSAVLALHAWRGWPMGRMTGGLLLFSYCVYLSALVVVA